VGLLGIMHVKADLLDGIGDVRAGGRQVLEGHSEAPKVSRISNMRPELGGDLSLCVQRRQNRLAAHHASSLKNIERTLMMSEEEPVHLMLNVDSQKMMEGSKVHGKFPLQSGYGLLQKCCAGYGENNVINVK
jgi:hypothetical protein